MLGVGLLLTAFPLAHGVILTNLYLPVALMLAGLILRGVAFDFRVRRVPTTSRGGMPPSMPARCWLASRKD